MQVMIQSEPGRREPRWRVRQDVAIDIPDVGVPRNQIVTVRNLSENGLLLESTGPLPVGSTISLALPDADEASAVVVWQQGGLHGCRFYVPLSKAAVNATILRSPIGNDLPDRKVTRPERHETADPMRWQPPTSLSVPTVVALAMFVVAAIVMIALS